MQVKKMEPLHNQAYQIIKKMIIEGELHPGERLVELRLAEKLGTSRGPIREAFRMLAHDGLLIQNESVLTIFNPNSQDIIDAFQCRQALESLAARLAAEHITDNQLLQIDKNIKDSKKALEIGNVQELSHFDQEFHDLIAQCSKNGQLIQLYEVIKSKIIYIRNCIIRNYYKNFMNFIDEHQTIYEALKARDPIKSEEEMRIHIQKNLEISYTLFNNK